jgi:hypothetical protein
MLASLMFLSAEMAGVTSRNQISPGVTSPPKLSEPLRIKAPANSSLSPYRAQEDPTFRTTFLGAHGLIDSPQNFRANGFRDLSDFWLKTTKTVQRKGKTERKYRTDWGTVRACRPVEVPEPGTGRDGGVSLYQNLILNAARVARQRLAQRRLHVLMKPCK